MGSTNLLDRHPKRAVNREREPLASCQNLTAIHLPLGHSSVRSAIFVESLTGFLFAHPGLFSEGIAKAPWDGGRQNHDVRHQGEREVEASAVSALELNVPDRARENLVARLWLAERPNRRATAKCQSKEKQHEACSHLPWNYPEADKPQAVHDNLATHSRHGAGKITLGMLVIPR